MKIDFRPISIAVVLLWAACPASAQDTARLPAGITPISYDIAIEPKASDLTFRGSASINVDVSTATPQLVLNAQDLSIVAATLDGKPVKVTVNPERQTAAFAPGGSISPGRHQLSVSYSGKINDSPSGLFHVDFPGGRQLATQFEPADARRFVPSFDEPKMKATFKLTAVVPVGQMAVSNMPVIAEQEIPGGLKRVSFAPTPRMSSYLLFFALGDFERITAKVAGTTIGVVIRRGDADRGRFALEAATQLLAYYNDYFGVKYPLPKLDLVGLAGEGAGAMENWGAILYTQSYIMVDPKLSTAADRQTVFSVVAHEMAHQWFGDLVTMSWWDDLWLNEGFASWMATKASDHFHPEWKPLLAGLADKDTAMWLDARSATHPVVQHVETVAQAEEAFDAITYMKGEAVIRMLEVYAGEDAWRRGVRAHIRAHAYGNAASTELWAVLDRAAGKPISAVARDFTGQPGVPLIDVTMQGSGIKLKQDRFGADEESKRPSSWDIPVRVAVPGGQPDELIIGAKGAEVPARAAMVINAGQAGYFRTRYDSDLYERLLAQLGSLSEFDQLGLLNDRMALGLAGYEPMPNLLRLARALPAGADPLVWKQLADALVKLDEFYAAGAARARFRTWATRTLRPALDRVGFDAKPGEAANLTVLRNRLLLDLSKLGDAGVRAEALSRFRGVDGSMKHLSADERRWVLPAVVRGADAAIFAEVRRQARASTDPLERQQLYEDMTQVEDPALARQVLTMALTDEPPSNTAPRIVQGVALVNPDVAWTWALANYQALAAKVGTNRPYHVMATIAGRSGDAARAHDLEKFAQAHIPPSERRNVNVAISQIRLAAKVRMERLPEVNAWVASHP